MYKPVWERASELIPRYAEQGIGYCYNERTKKVYLTILSAPSCVVGDELLLGAIRTTGHFVIPGGFKASMDVDTCVKRAKEEYSKAFSDNPGMLKYLN